MENADETKEKWVALHGEHEWLDDLVICIIEDIFNFY